MQGCSANLLRTVRKLRQKHHGRSATAACADRPAAAGLKSGYLSPDRSPAGAGRHALTCTWSVNGFRAAPRDPSFGGNRRRVTRSGERRGTGLPQQLSDKERGWPRRRPTKPPHYSTDAASTTTAMATRARQAVRGWGPYPTGACLVKQGAADGRTFGRLDRAARWSSLVVQATGRRAGGRIVLTRASTRVATPVPALVVPADNAENPCMRDRRAEPQLGLGDDARHAFESSSNAPLDSTHRSSRTGRRTSGWRRLR